MPNVFELIRDHVSLSISCIDRLYVNGYMPRLQTSGQLCQFLRGHLGQPLPSPALLRPIHDHFVSEVERFAREHGVPLLHFQRGQRKDDIVNRQRARFHRREGVVVIGVAQERAWSFRASKRVEAGRVSFDFSRQPVFVKHYYFYVQDAEWGPAFLKIGTYLPFPVKLCLNGHEWAKQQVRREGLRFEALDNGFVACRRPERLQEICDTLGPADVQGFFDRWSHRLPWPLSAADRQAGFDHNLSLWQMEVSLTQVFERPLQGRHFFEEVIRDNIDLGRPDRVALLFPTRLTRRTPAPPFGYRTRVITQGVNPSLHVEYRRSHVKQYFKEGRALRTETTFNEPRDFATSKALKNLPFLKSVGEQINRKLLEVERVSHNCALSQEALDRLQCPKRDQGQRIPALRFGDPRVMALFQALSAFDHVQRGFRNRDLRPRVAALLGRNPDQYSSGSMSYDLRRLRLHGLIARIPNSHRYNVTTYGLRVALLFTKLFLRVLRPNWPALLDEHDLVPRPLRQAFLNLEAEIDKLCSRANLRPAA